MTVLETLSEPFLFEFMHDAFAISFLIAVPAALLSCFILLKGWSLMGDAISHAVFPGVILSAVVGLPYAVGAFVAGMICGLASGVLAANSRIKQDTAMGIVFSGMFGLGLVLVVKVPSSVCLRHILFGNMLGVSQADIAMSGIIAVAIGGIIIVKGRDLLLYTFDSAHAKVLGLPVRGIHFGLLAMLSMTIVSALTSVGVILVVAVLIAPGAIAFLWTQRFSVMLALSVMIAATASFCGVYVSFLLDSSPSATIVLFLAAFFIVTLGIKSGYFAVDKEFRYKSRVNPKSVHT